MNPLKRLFCKHENWETVKVPRFQRKRGEPNTFDCWKRCYNCKKRIEWVEEYPGDEK